MVIQTRTYENCRIEDEDDGTVIKMAVVTTNGSAASIHEWDPVENRPRAYDRITNADIKTVRGGAFILTGISQQQVRTMRVPADKAVVHLKVMPGKGSIDPE